MKTKGKQIKNKAIKFLQKNWANAISIAISIIAILIAIQSNVYSKKASSANILIEDTGEVHSVNDDYQTWYLNIYGCDDDYSDGYLLFFETVGEFWLSNTGGLDTTLLTTDFASDFKIYDSRIGINKAETWSTGIYEHENPYTVGDLIRSLEIPAGKGMPINMMARNSAFFLTVDEAIRYYQSLTDNVTQDTVDKKGTWIFRFSDGKTYSKTYDKSNIRLRTYYNKGKVITLKEQLETSCKVMNREP